MAASPPPPGTDVRRLALLALTVSYLLLTTSPFTSCSTTSYSDSDSESNHEGNGEDEDGFEAEEPQQADNGLPHPAKPTAWHTRTFLYATPQPNPQLLFSCMDQVSHLASEAGNQQDMITASSHVTTLAAQEPTLYHYCFYQMMVRLDERLDRGGPLMTDMAKAFLDGMKSLWIFARGLDSANGRTQYFDYLQKRYIQLSKQYFGRDVEKIGPPMGNYAVGFGGSPEVMAKPAGPSPMLKAPSP